MSTRKSSNEGPALVLQASVPLTNVTSNSLSASLQLNMCIDCSVSIVGSSSNEMVNTPEALATGEGASPGEAAHPSPASCEKLCWECWGKRGCVATSISLDLSKQEFKCGNHPFGILIDQPCFQTCWGLCIEASHRGNDQDPNLQLRAGVCVNKLSSIFVLKHFHFASNIHFINMKFWLIFSAVACQYSLLQLKSYESSFLQTPLWQ